MFCNLLKIVYFLKFFSCTFAENPVQKYQLENDCCEILKEKLIISQETTFEDLKRESKEVYSEYISLPFSEKELEIWGSVIVKEAYDYCLQRIVLNFHLIDKMKPLLALTKENEQKIETVKNFIKDILQLEVELRKDTDQNFLKNKETTEKLNQIPENLLQHYTIMNNMLKDLVQSYKIKN